MIVPWLQVQEEGFERAVELAVLLDLSEAAALGHLVWLWRGALSRPSDVELSGRVVGPTAVAQIEAWARWRGPRGALVAALVSLGLVAEEADDKRVRGLDRYAPLLAKRAADRERAAKGRTSQRVAAKSERRSGEIAASRVRVAGSDADTDAEADADAESSATQTTEAPPPPVTNVERLPPVAAFELAKPDLSKMADWLADDFWRAAEHTRRAAGFPPEKWPNPRVLSAWWGEARAIADVRELADAFVTFTQDEHWLKATPPAPFAAFAKQFTKYLPRKAAAAC